MISKIIQYVLIPRNKFTLDEAFTWIVKNKYVLRFNNNWGNIIDKYYKFIQNEKPYGVKYMYNIKKTYDGIKIVFGIPTK